MGERQNLACHYENFRKWIEKDRFVLKNFKAKGE